MTLVEWMILTLQWTPVWSKNSLKCYATSYHGIVKAIDRVCSMCISSAPSETDKPRRPKGKISNTVSLFKQQQMEVMKREVTAKENFFKELLSIEKEKLQMLKAIA